jgi:CubicO group peptidase (beta-lactamase class C family)
MEHLLLEPLGLEESLLDHAAVLKRPFADGHIAMPINGRPALAVQTPLWTPRSVDPAGGIWATTRDVIRYGRFHLEAETIAGAANIVSPNSLLQMREPVLPIPGTPMQMGRDWFVQDVAGMRVFFHAGDTNGQHADFVAIPEQRFALAVLTNGQVGGSSAATAALDTALDQFPALTPLTGKIGLTYALTASPGAPTVILPADEVAEYAGRYVDPSLVISLTQQGEGLEMSVEQLDQPGSYRSTIQPPTAPPAQVAFLAEDMAVVGRTRMPFVRDINGRVKWISLGLRLVPRVEARV